MTTRRAWSSHDRRQARLDHVRPGAPLNGRTGMSIQANSAPTDERSALTDETQLTAHNRLGVLIRDDVGGVIWGSGFPSSFRCLMSGGGFGVGVRLLVFRFRLVLVPV